MPATPTRARADGPASAPSTDPVSTLIQIEPPGSPAPDQGGEREVTVEGLAARLRASVEGEVRFSGGDRALYATDASN